MYTIRNARTLIVAKGFLVSLVAAIALSACAVDDAQAEMAAPESDEAAAVSPDVEAARNATIEKLQASYEQGQKANRPLTAASFPELNGLRVKIPGQPHIYLVDRGQRRWIPNPETYDRLFRNWEGIQESGFYALVEVGPQISAEAQLVRGAGRPEVFLIEPYSKRWISSPAAMDRYYFKWENVWLVPRFMLDPIATGTQMD